MIQPHTNTGVIITPKDPSDWEAGGVTGITDAIVNGGGNWRPYESPGEWQKDMEADFETDACVSFSANDVLQTYGNFMISSGAWNQVTIEWLTKNGYFVDGKLHFSDRFTAKMSGTTVDGNSLGAVWNSIRKNGLVPESVYPFPINEIAANPSAAWDIYYSAIPAEVVALGKESLTYLQVNYEWLVSNGGGAKPAQFQEWLTVAPIQICTEVCPPWNTDEVIQGCGGGAEHATQLSAVGTSYYILDHYQPFEKTLALDYVLSYAVRATLTPVPLPASTPDYSVPIQNPVTPVAKQTYIQSLLIALQHALTAVLGISQMQAQGEGVYTLSMNPQTTNAIVGLVRGAGFVAIIAILTYLGDATHLTALGTYAPIVAILALALEHYLSPTGTALAGKVKIA